MPQDDQPSKPSESEARLAAIKADLKYYKDACRASAVGAQPPTVYAAKYAEDVEFLLDLFLSPQAAPEEPQPMGELEKALAHDAVGRVERKKR